MEAEDTTPFPFGKHKGTPLKDVPEPYYRWWIGTIPPRNFYREIQWYFCRKMGITPAGDKLELWEERLKEFQRNQNNKTNE